MLRALFRLLRVFLDATAARPAVQARSGAATPFARLTGALGHALHKWLQTQPERQGVMKIAGTLFATVVLLAGCSGGDDASPQIEPADGEQPAGAEAPDSLGACDDLAGLPTIEVLEVGLCGSDSGQQILMSANLECADGRTLHWNDYGWGYSGGEWQAHERADGQLVPPDADMEECRG